MAETGRRLTVAVEEYLAELRRIRAMRSDLITGRISSPATCGYPQSPE